MQRQWYLIDDDGIRPVSVGEPVDFWAQFNRDGEEAPWPEFAQLVLKAEALAVVEQLKATAPRMELELEEVTEAPQWWPEALILADGDEVMILAEPGTDAEDRLMAAYWAEELVGALGCDGIYFGYEPAAGTLHLTRYEEGKVRFDWCDSLMPGPSHALIFDEKGSCRNEDPRHFALKAMDLPVTSPLLDRHQFVMMQLTNLGLTRVSPDLADLPIAAAFRAHLIPSEGQGGGRH